MLNPGIGAEVIMAFCCGSLLDDDTQSWLNHFQAAVLKLKTQSYCSHSKLPQSFFLDWVSWTSFLDQAPVLRQPSMTSVLLTQSAFPFSLTHCSSCCWGVQPCLTCIAVINQFLISLARYCNWALYPSQFVWCLFTPLFPIYFLFPTGKGGVPSGLQKKSELNLK